MSYLDFPRLHFSGLLYNYPNTINNATVNFDPETKLTDSNGAYIYDVASWAPLGSGQIYFQDCVIRGAVDNQGRWIDTGDALIGAEFNTPSPFTPIPNGKDGTFDIPKMVNLDPDWDDRTEFYGMQLQVALPGGATFGGEMSVPQVREMSYDRFALNQTQKGEIHPYQQAGILLGVIENVQWPVADSGSPLLQQFMQACGTSVAVEMTMDLCWSRNGTEASIAGRRYLYGRVYGTLGPVRAGEGPQTIFGRRLQQLRGLGWSAAYAATSKVGSQAFLNIDLGMATPVAVQSWRTDGDPAISGVTIVDSVTVGVVDGTGSFRPFSNGKVSFAPYQYQYESDAKNCILLTNSGVFTIPLATGDAALAATGALALQANGEVVVREASFGIWIQFESVVARAEIDKLNVNVDVLVTQRGNPSPGYQIPGLNAWTWQYSGPNDSTKAVLAPGIVTASYTGATNTRGRTRLEIRALKNRLELQRARIPLDSQMFFFLPAANDPSISYGDYVVDRPHIPPNEIPPPDPPLAGAPLDAPVSVLVWQAFTPPDKPDWHKDILPILGGYSRLYPGMREKLDIGDRATAKGSSLGIAARMNLPVDDPAYMPVTRDLSPAKVKMVADFMTQWAQQPSGNS